MNHSSFNFYFLERNFYVSLTTLNATLINKTLTRPVVQVNGIVDGVYVNVKKRSSQDVTDEFW